MNNESIETTKQKLKDAFIELCESKGLSAVTVSGVTDKAGCNRCTFYNYYNNIQDILTEIEDEIFEKMQAHFENIVTNLESSNIDEFLPSLFSAIASIGEPLFILIGNGGDVTFREKLYKAIQPYHQKLIGHSVDETMLEYAGAFITSATLGLAEKWYKSNKDLSLEEFFTLSHSLLFNGLKGTIISPDK